jgi:hypothetical protein
MKRRLGSLLETWPRAARTLHSPRGGCIPRCSDYTRPCAAPVAQLDRALPSEGRGREFESRRVRHTLPIIRVRVTAYFPQVCDAPVEKRRITRHATLCAFTAPHTKTRYRRYGLTARPRPTFRLVCRIEQRSLISLLIQRKNSQGSHHRRGIRAFRPRWPRKTAKAMADLGCCPLNNSKFDLCAQRILTPLECTIKRLFITLLRLFCEFQQGQRFCVVPTKAGI